MAQNALAGREAVNILLVDDQPSKLLTYEAMLGSLGDTLVKAGAARQALEILLKTEIALILIDVCMPDLDGIELATMIRQHPRYRMIPIIFVSALQVSDLDRLRGYEVGAVDYVPVPVVAEVLRAKVGVFVELYCKTRELERMNAELEERVAERTAALEESSQRLQQLNAELEERVEKRTQERETALAQLFEAQKMETIGQLTGGIAHDFNNLLMAVTGSLELLKKRLPDEPRMHRLVDTAMQGADRGASLTQRLLAFSRRQELRPESVDVVRLIHNMTGLLERAAGPGIDIRTLDADALSPVRVDGHQLELAILNLVVNARDAMDGGGVLTICCTVPPDEARDDMPEGDYVSVSVTDTGAGMGAETIAKATEPFFTTKGTGKGTGLGLSMVHGLAAQSGGKLRIASELGAGTTVAIVLPVAATETSQLDTAEECATGSAPAAACSILLVDDDSLVAAGTRAMLEDLGHAVEFAGSAADAWQMLAQGPHPDLVLTDHVMPDMTGLTLAKKISETYPRLPVVIASGFTELPDLEDAKRYLRISKPYRLRELADLIARALAASA